MSEKHVSAKRLQEEYIFPAVLAALKKEAEDRRFSTDIQFTAVADAEDRIRLVVNNRDVFDVIVEVKRWKDPDLIYM